MAYKTGWRRSEIFTLEWGQVNLNAGIMRPNPGETKNGQGRTLYLDHGLKEIFNAQRAQFEKRKEDGMVCPYVFPNEAFKLVWGGNRTRTATREAILNSLNGRSEPPPLWDTVLKGSSQQL